jgi:hypothetical protein
MRGIFVAVALLVIPAVSAQSVGWKKYEVPESGARLDIPVTVFTEDAGEPDGGYGKRFFTVDKRANLTVQSVANKPGDSPATFLKKLGPPSSVVYKRVTQNFFVVSGFRNNTIWYNRCNVGGRFMNCVLINYPAAEKRHWDGVVTRISNTLMQSGS